VNLSSNSPEFVVIDASVMVGFCAKEPDKFAQITPLLEAYKRGGSVFYTPNAIIVEVPFTLCNKYQAQTLTAQEHSDAVSQFLKVMQTVLSPIGGDITLMKRAEEIRGALSCRHCTDGLYLALAEELAKQGATELLTFDEGQAKQAAAAVPQITVNLLKPQPSTP
jgi:predicted nucleic acid-binding protein